MALAELKKLVKNVKDLTKDLLAQNAIAEEILGKYKEKFNDVEDIEKGLAKIKEDLQKVQEQATDKLVIQFVGAVDSGKSSLINALLREDRLPTSAGESTVCSFKIVTTEEEKWSIQLGEESEKKYGNDFEEIKQLCSQMCNSENRARREELRITAESVLQVNWPEKLCKTLPVNVVLYDTPGFGETKGVFEIVKESCKTANILVAVMETKTPSLVRISELVNEAKKEDGVKYIFGVYTKWDEFMERRSRGNVPVDVEYLRRHHNQEFLREVYGRNAEEDEEEVFFVDVGFGESFDEKAESTGKEGFRKFEKRLVECAKELKRRIIKEKANSVELEFEMVFERFKSIIDARGKEKKEERDEVASLKKELESFTKIRESVKSPAQIMEVFFTEVKIIELVEKFEEIVKKKDKEEDVLKEFTDYLNAEIKAAEVSETKNLNQEYKKWKNGLKSKAFHSIHLPESLPGYNLKKLESQQKLPKELYNEFSDPHTYITSKALWGILTVAAGAAATVTIPGQLLGAAAAAIAVPEGAVAVFLGGARAAIGFVGGGLTATIGAVSNFAYGNKIMSQKKLKCWKENFSDKLRNLQRGNRKGSQLLTKETGLIFDKISSEAKKLPMGESSKLTREVEVLNQWSEELKVIILDFKKKKGTFQELQPTSQNPRGASENHTESQSAIDSTGTPI